VNPIITLPTRKMLSRSGLLGEDASQPSLRDEKIVTMASVRTRLISSARYGQNCGGCFDVGDTNAKLTAQAKPRSWN